MLAKITAIIFVLFLMLSGAGIAYSQQEGKAHLQRETSGTVAEVDFVGNKIALKAYEGVITFYVTEETTVTRGTDTISIEDIEQGDPLTVVYYVDEDGSLKATRITNNNLAEE